MVGDGKLVNISTSFLLSVFFFYCSCTKFEGSSCLGLSRAWAKETMRNGVEDEKAKVLNM